MAANDLHTDDGTTLAAEQADEILQTEEELKVKVILPWLKAIGFDASELTLERVQSILIGRHRVSVRYDFLARRLGRPLIFIEAKRPGHVLDDDDRRQARIYALLNEPIAPMAMLTNGVDTEVYDAFTNNRIDGSIVAANHLYFQEGYEVDPGADIRLRTNAIAQYVALSVENLRRFSSAQRNYRTSHLVSRAKGDVDRRVLPSLYVPSEELDRRWKSFLASDDRVFVTLGEPGIGKTNALWAFSEEGHDGRLALFLDAGRLIAGLWAAIRDDFGWAFSEDKSKETLVRSLSQISAEANCQILIFVDAIDENGSDGFPAELDDFCRRLADRGIRVAMSCRRWDWRRFERIKDAPTWVGEQARIETLPPFTAEELDEAWKRYAAAFEINTRSLSNVVAEKCRDRFTLRALCEFYSGGQVPDRIDVPDLLSEFVKRKLAKPEDSATLDACLVALARWMFERGASTIGSDELLGLPSVTPGARDSLLGCELIASTEARHYRFANGQVQDLFVAVRAGGWGDIPVKDFEQEAQRALSSAVGQQALSWFSQHFPRYRNVIAKTIRGRALSFIKRRNELVEQWLPGLRLALEPLTEEDAAVHLLVDGQRATGTWKLCPREPDAPLVVSEAKEDFLRPPHGPIHVGAGLDLDDAKGLLADEVEALLEGRQLRSAGLRERVPFLPAEVVIDELLYAEAAPFAEELGLPAVDHVFGGIYSGSFSREDLTEGIKFWSARWFAQEKVVRNKLDRGEIAVRTRDGISTYSSNLTEVDQAEVERLAAASLAGEAPIPLPHVGGDVPPVLLLLELLQFTRSQEFSSTIPEPDIPLTNRGSIESFFSPELKAKFIQRFFELALPTFREAAERLFAPAVRELATWRLQPVAIVWYLDPQTNQLLGDHAVSYALGKSPTDKDIVAAAPGRISIFDEEPLQLAGKEFTALHQIETSFSYLFLSPGRYRSDRRSAALTPLFDWVLSELRGTLRKDALLSLFERRS